MQLLRIRPRDGRLCDLRQLTRRRESEEDSTTATLLPLFREWTHLSELRRQAYLLEVSEEAPYSSSWAEAAFYAQHARQRTGLDAQRRRRSVSRKNRIDGVTSQSRSGLAHPGAAPQLRRRRIDREPRQSFARVTKLRGIQNRRIGGRGDSSHRPRKNSQSRERFVD